MKRVFIIITLMVFITGCGCSEKEVETFETNKVNLNEGVIEDKILDNFSTHNTSVIYEKGITTFKTELKANNETHINNIKIIFKTKNGKVLTELVGYINQDIKDTININITSDIDLSNAYSIEYVFE